jgi:hypothetical protein
MLTKIGTTAYDEDGTAVQITDDYVRAGKAALLMVVDGAQQIRMGVAKLCLGLAEVKAGRYYLIDGVQSYRDYAERIVGLDVRTAHRYAALGESWSEEIIDQLGITKAGALLALPVGDRDDLVRSAMLDTADGARYTIEDLQRMTSDEVAKIARKHSRELDEERKLGDTYKIEAEELRKQLASALDAADSTMIATLREQIQRLTESHAAQLAEARTALQHGQSRDAARNEIRRARTYIEDGLASLRAIIDRHEHDEAIVSEAHLVIQNIVDNLTGIGYYAR